MFFLNAKKYLILIFLIVLSLAATFTRNIDWQDEVAIWKDVVRKSPQKARGYYNLGIYYRRQKRIPEAIESYSKAIALDPKHTKARVNRGNVYDEQGEPLKAIIDYNAAIGINPEEASAYYNRGVTYNKIGQYKDAIADYQRSCELGYETACDALRHPGKMKNK